MCGQVIPMDIQAPMGISRPGVQTNKRKPDTEIFREEKGRAIGEHRRLMRVGRVYSPHLRKLGPKGQAAKGAFLGDKKTRCSGLIAEKAALWTRLWKETAQRWRGGGWLRGPVDSAARRDTVGHS